MEQDVQGRGKWTGEMKYLRRVGRNEHPKKESGRDLYLGQQWSLKRLRRAKIRRGGGVAWKTGCKGSVLTGYITGAPSMVLAPRSSFQGKSKGSFRTRLEGEFQTLSSWLRSLDNKLLCFTCWYYLILEKMPRWLTHSSLKTLPHFKWSSPPYLSCLLLFIHQNWVGMTGKQ